MDAAKMVFESRFGFDMVDFGEELPDGTIHTGEWLIFKGHRMKAKLVYFKAEMTDEAAFSYSVPGMGIVHAWIWNICVDNLLIIECQGNHFDVMLPNEEGGDLTHAIVPFMGQHVQVSQHVLLVAGSSVLSDVVSLVPTLIFTSNK